jgi:N-acetylglutamate synthase-like GNAT family acetyltransferase
VTEEIVVRRATADDAEALADLRFRFAVESNRRGDQSYEDFVAHFSTYFRDTLASGRWLAVVAECEGRVVGHAYLETMDKLPVPGRPARRMGYVTNVYVEPDLRDGGVGTQVLQEVIRLGREMALESLVLWPTSRSIPFYRRAGFEPTDALELDFS